MKLRQLIDQFLEHKEVQEHCPPTTHKNYSLCLRRFIDCVGDISPKEITPEKCHEYYLYIGKIINKKGSHLSLNWQAYHRIVLRSFLKYLNTIDVLDMNNKAVSVPAYHRPEREFLTQKEINLFLQYDPKTLKEWRDYCIFELFYCSGLRLSELRGLNINTINYETLSASVVGKRKKRRLVYVNSTCCQNLIRYIAMRQDSLDPLFISFSNRNNLDEHPDPDYRRMPPDSIENSVRDIAKLAGIPRRVNPHMLRHTYATKLLEMGVDIRTVQELLDHSHVSTTQIYTHVTDTRKKEQYEKAYCMV